MYPGERFNGLTHLGGTLLALAGAVVLVVMGSLKGDPWRIASFSIYGATLVFLYLSSTLYHSTRGRTKSVFRKLDHAAIYLLIAGTYTPFTLVTLNGPWGWSLFGTVWGLTCWTVVMLGIFGAAMFYGDSMITPAISVLSAVVGIAIATPVLSRWVVPAAVAILAALFMIQRHGTARVGSLIGPITALGSIMVIDLFFAWMNRNAMRATDFFNIPINRVVELGTHVDI
jgi:predicted membrane channel-forming protein YqfA (hemolysin III family)